jgi:hypothetical protein
MRSAGRAVITLTSRTVPRPAGHRLADPDDVAGDRGLDLVVDSHGDTGGVDDSKALSGVQP